jgi:hypothetical protein
MAARETPLTWTSLKKQLLSKRDLARGTSSLAQLTMKIAGFAERNPK